MGLRRFKAGAVTSVLAIACVMAGACGNDDDGGGAPSAADARLDTASDGPGNLDVEDDSVREDVVDRDDPSDGDDPVITTDTGPEDGASDPASDPSPDDAPVDGSDQSVDLAGDGAATEDVGAIDGGGDGVATNGGLIISEVVDHADNSSAKFVELYNASTGNIGLAGWSLENWANGRTLEEGPSASLNLTAIVLEPGDLWVVAHDESSFSGAYSGRTADQYHSVVANGNGDDTYVLRGPAGIADIYGEIGVDGTDQPWEYVDSVARRNDGVTQGRTTWLASEWTITAGADNARPGIR